MRKKLIFVILLLFNLIFIFGINYANKLMQENNFMIYLDKEDKPIVDDQKEENIHANDTEFNGESIEVIGKKINKVFEKTSLEGYGEYVSKTSIKNGVNPYLIGGIILESTNCKNECSVLFKQCNNVFEAKGNPGCFGGTYKEYDKLEDSINDLVISISKKYGETEQQAPYKMYGSYDKNTSWAYKVNKYMETLKRG